MSAKNDSRIVQPYLSFEVYRKALGAEVAVLVRFKDSTDPDPLLNK